MKDASMSLGIYFEIKDEMTDIARRKSTNKALKRAKGE